MSTDDGRRRATSLAPSWGFPKRAALSTRVTEHVASIFCAIGVWCALQEKARCCDGATKEIAAAQLAVDLTFG